MYTENNKIETEGMHFIAMVEETKKTGESIRRIRGSLAATGFFLALAGALCIVAPHLLTVSAELTLGGAMLLTGLVTIGHLALGYLTRLLGGFAKSVFPVQTTSVALRESSNKKDGLQKTGSQVVTSGSGSSSASSAERAPVWTLVLIQVGLGAAILLWPGWARFYLSLAIAAAVAVEGGLILWASVHFESQAAKIAMWLSGLVSLTVAVVSFMDLDHSIPTHWISYLIGAKMLLMGSTFLWAGLRASDNELKLAYCGLSQYHEQPNEGSIYAVFYGPAFHCGISVGNNQIVDYLTDGIVRLITWEEFLLGRRAMEWNYPDVPAGEPEQISAYARSLAGSYTKYDALKFNCESLAIKCRSIGKTDTSNFSQATVSLEMVQRYPWLGSLVQVLQRGASWFLYGMGGPFGKKVGFIMIRLTRAITNWFIVRPLRRQMAESNVES
ncbi:MAG: Lecithin retinol acyltransferase [Planctomycetota bacterium]|jgi:uncharacterized membrane protein HdeD (DUF308 family)